MAADFQIGPWLKQSAPQEHGSWSYVAEPLLVAGLASGGWTAAAGVFLAFLAYRPVSLGVRDLLKRKVYPRTWPSLVVGLGLGAGGSALVVAQGDGRLVAALATLGGLFAVLDSRADRRSLLRELAGAGLALPTAVLAAPHAVLPLVIRPLTGILSVRGKLGRLADASTCRWIAVASGAAMAGGAWYAFGPDLRTLAYTACGCRALHLALTAKTEVKPAQVGVVEGLLAVGVVLAWSASPLASVLK